MNLLADAAPDGTGLAIVGAILVAFLLVCLAVVVLLARFVMRALRKRREPAAAPPT